MAKSCLLYYITDRKAFPGDESERRCRLLEKIAEAVRAGVDYIQLREIDLSTRELESLAREAVSVIREARKLVPDHWPPAPAFLINSRTDVALAVGANGVHLRSDDVSPRDVRNIWQLAAGTPTLRKARRVGQPRLDPSREPLIGISCHSAAEVEQAAANDADLAVFAPIFEKKDTPGAQPSGLSQLEQACRANIAVLALGGVTLENACSCLDAGAAGIAAIRLFQEKDVAEVVRTLRPLAG